MLLIEFEEQLLKKLSIHSGKQVGPEHPLQSRAGPPVVGLDVAHEVRFQPSNDAIFIGPRTVSGLKQGKQKLLEGACDR